MKVKIFNALVNTTAYNSDTLGIFTTLFQRLLSATSNFAQTENMYTIYESLYMDFMSTGLIGSNYGRLKGTYDR